MKDTVIIPDFVSVVGSVAEGKRAPEDLDVLFRGELTEDRRYLTIQVESLVIALRDALRESGILDDKLSIHPIFAAQGPHDKYVPLGDLVVRWKEASKEQSARPLPDAVRDIVPDDIAAGLALPDGLFLNVGCGEKILDGFVNIDNRPIPGVPVIVGDIRNIPVTDGSVALILASHVLEHVPVDERVQVFREFHRALREGGVVVAVTPLAHTPGADMPFHLSEWSPATFAAFGNPEIARTNGLPLFEVIYIDVRPGDRGENVWDVVAVLRKPVGAEGLEGAEAEQAEYRKARWPKPAVRFYTEHFSPSELWEKWGATRAPFAVEPKLNGFRCQVEKRGDSVRIVFEDTEEDRSAILSPLVRSLIAAHFPDAVLDGDIGVVEKGRRWPRPALAALLGSPDKFDWEGRKPVLTVFDALEVEGKDIRNLPFRERREILDELLRQHPAQGIQIAPQAIVRTEDELKEAFARFARMEQSEGIVTKTLDAPYPSGPTDEWAKIKVRLEVRVRVAERKVLRNGMFIYLCQWGDGGFAGWTMPTRIQAKPGDVITVATPELNRVRQKDAPEGWSVTWTNGVVQDVVGDTAHEPPYAREQALSLARRFLATSVQEKAQLLFGLHGSKFSLARWLVPHFPKHRVFVDPYVGTGSILLRKPRSEEEHINDLNVLIVGTFRYIKGASDEELMALTKPITRKRAEELVRKIKSGRASDSEIAEWVVRGVPYRWRGFVANWLRELPVPKDVRPRRPPDYDELAIWRERLRGVHIHHKDALRLIQELDSPDTFFYLDPPYRGVAGGRRYAIPVARIGDAEQDFLKLIEMLKGLKGRFLLSCVPESIAGLELPSSWHVREVPVEWRFSPEGSQKRKELVIANYDLDATAEANRKYVAEHGRYPWEPIRPAQPTQHRKETRGEIAEAHWEQNWHRYWKRDGEFVIQHHWRGLGEDEVGLSEEELARRGHSVHADIRFDSPVPRQLWGISVFWEGDRPGLPVDQISALAEGEALRGGPKLPEPVEWKDVARSKPFVAGPGKPGATSRKYAKIVEVDRGQFKCGVWNRHFIEVVLYGKKVRGRFVLQRARPGLWFFKRVNDTPLAESSDIDDAVRRLEQRGHSLLIWARPGGKPRRVVIKGKQPVSGAVLRALQEFARRIRLRNFPKPFIIIGDRIVVVSTNNFQDTDGDIVAREAIRGYLKSGNPSGTIRLFHQDGTDFADVIGAFATGHYLFHVAKFRDTPFARKVKEFLKRYPAGHPKIAPNGWGTSMRFIAARGPGGEFQYIRHIETSILPWERAANPWSPLTAIQGGENGEQGRDGSTAGDSR